MKQTFAIALLLVVATLWYRRRSKENDINNYSLENFPILSTQPEFDIVKILNQTSS